MKSPVEFKCGYDEAVRQDHKKAARAFSARNIEPAMAVAAQRSIFFTSAARHIGQAIDAVGLALQLDQHGDWLPAANENGVEIDRPPRTLRKARTNVLILLGSAGGLPALLLADVMPRYLYLVSGCRTALVAEEELGEQINKAYGWTRMVSPVELPPGFVAIAADGNPMNSCCGRAIVYGRERDEDRYFIDSLATGTGDSYTLVADNDARQLTSRAYEAWGQQHSFDEDRVVEEVMQEAPVVSRPRIIDRPA